jgi:signal transduction histidine kinase
MQDLVRIAAALGGGPAVLTLGAGAGAGAGLTLDQWRTLAGTRTGAGWASALAALGLGILAQAPVGGTGDPEGGCLWLLGRAPAAWDPARQEALELLARQVWRALEGRGEGNEQRARARGPLGSSFVPGLVHELRNFSFGISGSLDAFQARQGDPARYGGVMRASLDRLNAFLGELADYGDPAEPAWTGRDPEALLREAVECHRDRAAASGTELRLDLEGPLPLIRADERSLGTALARLVQVALGPPGAGGRVVVRAAPAARAGGQDLEGWVEGSRRAFPGLDLARLFEPFHFRTAGLGRLALPVARRVFERHGGSLRAVPGPEGGVRMVFRLPGA